MKKIIYTILFFILTFSYQMQSQIVVDDGFENATCGNIPPNYSPFFDGCLDGWIATHGSPSLNDGNISAYEGNNYAYMYVEYDGFCWPEPWRGEGIALNYDFQEGFTYKISYAIRGHNSPPPFATFERNWVLTNGLTNNHGGSNGCPNGEIIPDTPPNSQFLPTPNYNNNNWTVNEQTFTADNDFSQIWFRARNHHTTINAQVFSRMFLDAVQIEIIDTPCVPDEIIITANREDITDTLTYTIPCGQNCFTLHATNITNAVYNTNNNQVLTDLNGLFCLIDGSDLTSFNVTITGLDSCGDPYNQNITINVEQDCCPHIEMVRLWDNSYQNPSGASPDNYSDFTDHECIPIFDTNFPQINFNGSQDDIFMALYIDVNGDGDFNDPGEELHNAFDLNGGVGVSFQVLINNGIITGGELIRVIVSDTAIIDGEHIPDCGEVEDYILCDPCPDEPVIEPYWQHPDCPEVVCTAEQWPIHVLSSNGTPITSAGGIVISWDNLDTPVDEAILADWIYTEPMQTWQATITYPDGCEYIVTYFEDCCDDDIYINVLECPTIDQLQVYEAQLLRSLEINKNAKVEKLLKNLQLYKEERLSKRDCDPCELGIVFIELVDANEDPIVASDYDSITWSDGGFGTMRAFSLPMDEEVCFTAVKTDGEIECVYEDCFFYECETECSPLSAPTNLQVIGDTLTWDPVPGAVGYIVSSPVVPRIECCRVGVSILPINTTTNSVELPVGLQRSCFIWQVTAICRDGSRSSVSEQECHLPSRENTIENVLISPNPTRGDMTFTIQTYIDANVVIEIYNFYGNKVNTLTERVASYKEILFDGTRLPKGIYFIKFRSEEQIITKKIIIN